MMGAAVTRDIEDRHWSTPRQQLQPADAEESKEETQPKLQHETKCMKRCVEVYAKQLDLGERLLREQPGDSATRALDEVKEVMKDPRAGVVQEPT